MITERNAIFTSYRLEYFSGGIWYPLLKGFKTGKIKIHRSDRVWGDKIRLQITSFKDPAIAEFGVYNERR